MNYQQLTTTPQQMRETINKLQKINENRNELINKSHMSSFQMAMLLKEVRDGQYAEKNLGVSFKDFVGTLYDESGNKRTYLWAKGLITYLKTCEKYPVLYHIMYNQCMVGTDGTNTPMISLTQGYYVSRIATEDNWEKKIIAAMIAEGWNRDNPDWDKEKQNRLASKFLTIGTASVRYLKDKLKELQTDKASPGDESISWPYHGGRLDPEVKKTYDEVIKAVVKFEGLEYDPDQLSYVQEIELLSRTLKDMMHAIEEATMKGNTKPLRSLMLQKAENEEEE